MKASLSFLFLTLVSFFAFGQTFFPQKFTKGQWLKSWMVCGAFPLQQHTDPNKLWDHLPGFETDYLKKYGGETNLAVKAGDVVKYGKGSAKWKYYESPDSTINLVTAISKASPVCAYAYTEVSASESGLWLLSFGTNDGGRLWVNGEQMWDYPSMRGLKPDNDRVPVFLKKGKNTLLLKVEQHGSNWGFCARFLEFSAQEAADRGELFRIESNDAGNSNVGSAFSNSVLTELVNSLEVKIYNHQEQLLLNEKRNFPFSGLVKLPTSDYQTYTAHFKAVLKNSEIITHKQEFTSGKRMDYKLFSQKKSDYQIALSADASESEQWAAKELQHWLKEISGVEIPVVPFSKNPTSPQIVLGFNSLVAEKTGAKQTELLDESFRYFNSGADIFIYGGKQRGTMYGVFSFLERELGCRWYTPSVTVIPERNEYKFNWLDHAEKPGVRVRNDFYFEAFEPIWAARNRVNGSMGYREQPGGIESYWAVHTFYPLMPPEEFFAKHPNYYSLIDGKRIHDHAQLCLSNPDVLKIITERIKDRMRKSPEYLIYDVSQNDWGNPCQCEKCQALTKKYGGESGIVIWFVNQVAEAVEKEFPDKFIGTLAYQYTRHAPANISPRENVVVRLCSIECCVAHDFECLDNRSFLTDLQNWSTLAPHLYIWDYVVNFNHYILPLPNFWTLQSKIKAFQKNNAIGIMEQAAYQSRGGEFAELRAYLIAKLLWNPECDTKEVISDFIAGYYGRSGKFVYQYFDLLQGQVTPHTHFQYGLTPTDQIYSEKLIEKAERLFAEAEKVADNDEVLRRVEMAVLPVLYLKCKRTPVAARLDGTYAKFCRIAEREGITHYAEAGELHKASFHREVENAR
jgi:hypothetical protein